MKRRKVIARLVFLLYFAAVLYLCFGNFSSLSEVTKRFLGFEADKVAHFLMFFPFPVLFYMAFGWRTRKPWHSIALTLFILALGTAIAAGTELVQDLIPYRASDRIDFLADFLALCCSSVFTFLIDLNKTIRHA
jgi:VanZ family protein